MENRVRVWLDGDRGRMHHAPISQVGDMATDVAEGRTDCGRAGLLHMIEGENIDEGKLCPDCLAVTGVRPPLGGQGTGPD